MQTVKEVSRQTGISVRTLHYYDQIGLLKPAAFSEAGYPRDLPGIFCQYAERGAGASGETIRKRGKLPGVSSGTDVNGPGPENHG